MKTLTRIISVLVIASIILSALCFTASAAVSAPTMRNTGTRNEVATSLSDMAKSYYTAGYTYDELANKNDEELLTALRGYMTTTHTGFSSYKNCKEYSVYTDCQKGGDKVVLLYSSYEATMEQWATNGSNGWNREHVWPKSLGDFDDGDSPGCDLHHVRPADAKINGTRSNKKYNYVTDGKEAPGILTTVSGGNSSGSGDNGYFEPLDNVKGDVARICLYVYVRYGGQILACNDITNVFESVDVLLEWCELDPVDTWELSRNDVVSSVQGNRNVFIDYPEYAWLLFDEEIPADMQTPSGMAKKGTEDTPVDPAPVIPDPGDPTPDDPTPENPAPVVPNPETDATEPATEDKTEEKATEATDKKDEGNGDATADKDEGCGSVISISAICIVGIVGAVTVVKKKED